MAAPRQPRVRPTSRDIQQAAWAARDAALSLVTVADTLVFGEVLREYTARAADPMKWGRLPSIPVAEVYAHADSIDRLVAAGLLVRAPQFYTHGVPALYPTANGADWVRREGPRSESDTDPCDVHQRLADAR